MRTLLLSAVLVLVLAAAAAAQTVSGKVTDPQFDMTPQQLHWGNDLSSVEMTYNAQAGTLRGVVEDYGEVGPDESSPWFTFYADLGRVQPNGSCAAAGAGSLLTSFYTPDDSGMSPMPAARVIGGPQINGTLVESGIGLKTYTFQNPALVGLSLDCVTDIHLDSVHATTDAGTSFCMSPTGRITCPVATPTPTPSPTATPTPTTTATPVATPKATPIATVIAAPVITPQPKAAPAPLDTTAPALTLSFRRSQHIGRPRTLSLAAGCGAEACFVTAKGTIGARSLRSARADVAAGASARLRLKLSRRTLEAVRRALRDDRAVRAHLTITAADAAGNRTTRAATIRVR